MWEPPLCGDCRDTEVPPTFLIPVAVREFLMPPPGAFDDGIDALELRPPAEFALNFFRSRDEARRIASAPRFFYDGNFVPRDFAARIDHLAHAGAAAGAKIVEVTLRGLQRQNMRAGEIQDVDVVADASAVRRIVIRAVNFHVRVFSERDLQHVRDEVSLNAMFFAEIFRGARGVEITQRDEAELVNLVVPAQDFFESQLRFTVRIDRTLRRG